MQTTTRLSRILRYTAAVALIATIATWLGTGAHVGWTQTTLTTMQHDEITGIDYPVHRSGFVAGLELVAVGLAAATALAGASLLSQRRAVRA